MQPMMLVVHCLAPVSADTVLLLFRLVAAAFVFFDDWCTVAFGCWPEAFEYMLSAFPAQDSPKARQVKPADSENHEDGGHFCKE